MKFKIVKFVFLSSVCKFQKDNKKITFKSVCYRKRGGCLFYVTELGGDIEELSSVNHR